jgi:thiol-disulfide isomerase/thioredoxin
MRGKVKSSRNNNLSLKGVSSETVVIVVLLVVLLVLVVYYVRQNSEGFQSGEKCTVYAFVADWCPHCTKAKPALTNLKNNAPSNVTVNVVNEKDDNARELMTKYGVKGFPTVLLIKSDGTTVEFEQRVTESNLNEFVANNAVGGNGNGNGNGNAGRNNGNGNGNGNGNAARNNGNGGRNNGNAGRNNGNGNGNAARNNGNAANDDNE